MAIVKKKEDPTWILELSQKEIDKLFALLCFVTVDDQDLNNLSDTIDCNVTIQDFFEVSGTLAKGLKLTLEDL